MEHMPLVIINFPTLFLDTCMFYCQGSLFIVNMSLNERNSCTISVRLSMMSECVSARNFNLLALCCLNALDQTTELESVSKYSNFSSVLFLMESDNLKNHEFPSSRRPPAHHMKLIEQLT